MNSNNIKLLLFATSCIFLINCKQNSDNTSILKENSVIEVESTKYKIIDSLSVDLNNDGNLDKVLVKEDNNFKRLLLVKLKESKIYKLISSNNQIIGCGNCGYQSGDPYIGLNKINNGFEIEQEHIKMSFIYQQDKILLKKIDILRTTGTENGIEEEHQILSMDKFGRIELSNLIENFEVDLLKKYFKNELIESYILKACENSRFEIKIQKNNSKYNFTILDKKKIISKGIAILNQDKIKLGKIEGTISNNSIVILNFDTKINQEPHFTQCGEKNLTFIKQ